MPSWERSFTGGSYAGSWRSRLDYWVASTSGNSSLLALRQYIYSTSSGVSQNGSWDGRTYINGGQVNRNTPNANISNGQYLMNASDHWLGHDVNGNLSISVGSYCNAPVNDMNHQNTGYTLPRIPAAPNIIANVSDQITDTTVRLGTEIDSLGHGTSAATRMYYKTPEAGGWTQTSDQGDVGGYNYWTITGLVSNKKYYRLARWWNNNGDTSDLPASYPSESYFFVTLANGTTTVANLLATTVTINTTATQGHHATTSKIQYRKQGDATWIDTANGTGATPSFNLSGLLPNTTYEYRLAITTSAGTWNQATQTLTTLPAGKLVYPNGTVKNAIPRIVRPNGSVTMLNINLVD
jgi:hypothetical protein